MDRGMAYGEACFETFRVINGVIFDWPAHLERLRLGLAEFGISLTVKELASLHPTCLCAAAEQGSDAMVRLTVTGGEASRGLMAGRRRPRVYVQAMAYQPDTNPLCLALKAWPMPPKMRMAKFTADYSDTLRALNGCADVNVLFSYAGHLLGAATANVLIYRQHRWCTPAIGPGVLPGIVRAHLLAAGLLTAADCPLSQLEACEAVALTNCGFFLRPVARIDRLNYDIEHPAFRQLVEVLADEPGVIIQ